MDCAKIWWNVAGPTTWNSPIIGITFPNRNKLIDSLPWYLNRKPVSNWIGTQGEGGGKVGERGV